jgi:radical SAM superfamily enzyme YgiQ (UPF0313 family)
VEDIEHAIAVLHEYGIRSHGMFVLGAEHDGPGSVRDTVTFALKNRIDTVMMNILTPLPGTQQFHELDAAGRLITRDWRLYDAQHAVFWPRHMSPAKLQRDVLREQRRFYHTGRPVKAFFTWLLTRDAGAWNRMLEYGWLWWYSRMWWKDPGNREHLRMLEQLAPFAPPSGPATPASGEQPRHRHEEPAACEGASRA